MQEPVRVTGMVLEVSPVGETDRRVVLLTKERGKISAFARGARKQGSRLMAATNPFCFGEFILYEGRNSYSLSEAVIRNYFEDMRMHFEEACYGMYFLELMDYYTRENNDEREMLLLLYQSLRALLHAAYDNRLVRYIFEIKAVVLTASIRDSRKTRTMKSLPGMPCSISQTAAWRSCIHLRFQMRFYRSLRKLQGFIREDLWIGK